MKRWVAVFLIGMVGILQYRLWYSDGNVLDVIRLTKAISAEREGNQKLVQRNHALDAEVDALKKFPEALEERARAELGMIKQDETFCLVVEPAR